MTNPNTPDALSQKQAASAPHRLPQHELLQEQRFWKLLSVADWLFAALMMAIAAAVQILLPHRMDSYEVCILWLSAAATGSLGELILQVLGDLGGLVLYALGDLSGLVLGSLNGLLDVFASLLETLFGLLGQIFQTHAVLLELCFRPFIRADGVHPIAACPGRSRDGQENAWRRGKA